MRRARQALPAPGPRADLDAAARIVAALLPVPAENRLLTLALARRAVALGAFDLIPKTPTAGRRPC